ncbi:Deferrochelatase/peroxidase EfeB precursor [Raoultella terrigena]|uniref:Deferrochelatase/peroxidase EfeB n=1 Tax=Raoultella terrigena TaxID=577 RepID=A0A4U9DDB5_RAOTE|nr:Deferrochelatase/peroxidase EfeB precursor [Raoultella terrigena]
MTNSGQLDMGLLFVCYQHDLEKGFLTVQKRLTAKRWRSTSSRSAAATFLRCRGVKDSQQLLAQSLLEA